MCGTHVAPGVSKYGPSDLIRGVSSAALGGRRGLLADDDVVDRDEDELHKEADEADNAEAKSGGHTHPGELLEGRLLALLNEGVRLVLDVH